MMKNLLLITLFLVSYVGFAQCVDPVLTDFECTMPSHPLSGGTTVETIANPFSTGINTSANVGLATDDGTQGFDALISEYGAPIDLTTNPIFHINVYTELTTPIPLVAKVEGGGTPLEIATTIDVSNEWKEYTFDFSSVAGTGNTRLVVFFNFAQTDGTASDIYYIDDLFFGPAPTQCVDPILTDFECDLPSHPLSGGTTVETIANPFSTGINTSANVGLATDDGTQGFDALISEYGAPIDLTANPIFHIKVYTELVTPIPLVAKVEGGGTPLEIATDIDVSNEWKEYTFDFSSVAGTGNTRLVVFFNFAQSDGTTSDIYYIDDLFFGPAPTQCEDPILTDFECDLPSHPFSGGTTVETIANPFSTGINTSANVGLATDDGTQGFDALISEYGAPIDLTNNPIFHIKIYTELVTPIPLVAKVEGGGTPLEILTDIDVSNEWKEYTFDFSSVVGTGNTRLVVFFNFAQSDGTISDIYYIDDLFFGPPENLTFTYVDDVTGWMPNDPSDPMNPSTVSDNIVIQNGTATISESIIANNVTVNTGAILNAQDIEITGSFTIDGDSNIFGVLTPNSSEININGTLTLKSVLQGTSIVADASNATINGTVTAERYIPASNRAFRLLSTPVVGAGTISSNWQQDTHITGAGGSANGFDDTQTNNPSMFIVNEQLSPANYEAVTSTTSTPLSHGVGYLTLIRGDRSIDLTDNNATPTETTLRSSGTLFQGTLSLGASVLNTGDFEAGGNGSSLIANPYHAPINMEQVLNSSSQINQEFIHVYDAALGERGAFVTVGFGTAADGSEDDTNFTFDPGMGGDASPTTASRFLQSGRAAFVNTIDPGVDGSANPTITFNETDKATDVPSFSAGVSANHSSVQTDLSRINFALYDQEAFENDGTPRDGLTIRFSDQYSNDIEMTDAYKAYNLDENFASSVNDRDFSIQSRSLPTAEEIIDLSITNFTKVNYVLRAHVNNLNDVNAYLVDSYLGTQTLLNNNSESIIPFSINAGDADSMVSDRFYITFEDSALSVESNEMSEFIVFPNPVTDGKLIVRLENKDAHIYLVNLLGQMITNIPAKTLGDSQVLDVSQLKSGIYIVQLESDGKTSSSRVIIQ